MPRAAASPQPRGLVLDLLATLRTGSMPVRALVAAGALFGIDENRMRVAVARALAEGAIERDQRGEYRRRARRGLGALVTGWRQLDQRMTRWNGEWIAVLATVPRGSDRTVEKANRRALERSGFRSFQRGVALRPANLTEPVGELRTRLVDLGLRDDATMAVIGHMDENGEQRARGLWDTAAIRAGYERSLAKLDASRRRLEGLSEARAMRESFTLGGEVIRQIVLDPLLPPPLVPAGEFAALLRAMRSYERLGRAGWRAFLERHGVDFHHAPAELEAADAGVREHALGELGVFA